jgi:hypothetical protein
MSTRMKTAEASLGWCFSLRFSCCTSESHPFPIADNIFKTFTINISAQVRFLYTVIGSSLTVKFAFIFRIRKQIQWSLTFIKAALNNLLNL